MSKDNDLENSPQEEYSIGDLLRTEREKKGISKSRLAEAIKVREHVIDALENEEWDKLPARVFIKGFIRSYTISIGCDTQKALRLFDKSVPSRGENYPPSLTGRKKKSRAKYYVLPILIILAVAVYFLTIKDNTGTSTVTSRVLSETSQSTPETSQGESLPEQVKPEETVMPAEAGKTTDKGSKIQEIKSPEPEKITENVPVEETIHGEAVTTEERSEPEKKEVSRDEASQNTVKKPEETAETAATAEEETSIPRENVTEVERSEPETDSVIPPELGMLLSAKVNMRTYVKIIVDDNPPKEYIFKPGSNPRWTAERGFEVTVGNAAGIEFEFNGETYKDLGDIGKVKTFHFPRDFETNWKEE